MSFITRFALDNTRLTIVFIAAVLLIGLSQFFHFPRQEDPPITIREVVVVAFYPGMKPADVEELITRKLEAQIRTLPEIDDIWSDSKSGTSIIHAETRDEYSDLDTIWQKVRNKMIDIQPELPSGTIGPFVNDEFGLTAVATMALWADGFSMAEMRLVARDIRDRLYELKGVRKVELYGVQDEQVFLKFSASKLSQFGISLGKSKTHWFSRTWYCPAAVSMPPDRTSLWNPPAISVPWRILKGFSSVFPEQSRPLRLKICWR